MERERIDAFWRDEYFGCPAHEFSDSVSRVYPHRYLAGYRGLFILKIRDKYLISAPESDLPLCRELLKENLDLLDASVLEDRLSGRADRIIGPSWLGYPLGPVRPPVCGDVLLFEETSPLRGLVLSGLRGQCGEEEWSYSGIDGGSAQIAVCLENGEAVCAASYELWGKRVAHVGIITHPLYRGRGCAKKVLNLMTGFLLERGLIPQVRTLCANIPMIKAARSCGFKDYAQHMSIRLK